LDTSDVIVPLPLYRQDALSERQRAAVRALFFDASAGPEVCGTTDPDQSHQDVALSAVNATLRRFGEEARRRWERLLFRRATRIANKFVASAAWLFLLEEGGFRAVFAHKNRHRDECLRADEPSWVARVARLGTPDVAPSVPNPDRYPDYKETLPDTRSIIATPIRSPEGEILGVFHLESANVEEYGEKDLKELEEAADDLAGLLLVLRALECGDDRWFPWRDSRFDLSLPLWEILDEVRKAIDPTGVQCTIWAADRQRGGLFVYATTGQAEEFESQKTMPVESYSGALAASPPGAVGVAGPGADPGVGSTQIIVPVPGGVEIRPGHPPYRGERPFYLKWIGSLGAPIYARLPQSAETVSCALTISCFEGVEESRLPSHDELTQIAQEIGDFITGFLHLREQLAVYHLRTALHLCRSHRRDWTIKEEFRVIGQKFTEFLGLEAIAIAAPPAPNRKFRVIARKGHTEALLASPDDVDDPYRIVHEEVKDERGEVIGVIHMSRCRPFSTSDKELIHRLTGQGCVLDTFLRWQVVVKPRRNLIYAD
jgi:hypothetical protein